VLAVELSLDIIVSETREVESHEIIEEIIVEKFWIEHSVPPYANDLFSSTARPCTAASFR
jgi:hypothetical protein